MPCRESVFSGRPESLEELHSLAAQAESLAERLVFMNRDWAFLTPR